MMGDARALLTYMYLQPIARMHLYCFDSSLLALFTCHALVARQWIAFCAARADLDGQWA